MLGQSLKNAQEQNIFIFKEVNPHHLRIFFFQDVFTMDLAKTLKYCLDTFFRNTVAENFNAASTQSPQNGIFTPQMQSWAAFSIQFRDTV